MTDPTPSSDATEPKAQELHYPLSPTTRAVCYGLSAILFCAGFWVTYKVSSADSSTMLVGFVLGLLGLLALLATTPDETQADSSTHSRRSQVVLAITEFLIAACVFAYAIVEGFRLYDGRINDNRGDQLSTVAIIVICALLAAIIAGGGLIRLDRTQANTATGPTPTDA